MAGLAFVLVYGSDIALTVRADLLLGTEPFEEGGGGVAWHPWAYVPVEAMTVNDAQPMPEQGEPVLEDHAAQPNLAANDLFQRVLSLRKRLRINVDGTERQGVPYAPLRSLLRWLGGDVKWAGEGQVSVFSSVGLVVLRVDSSRAERNYSEVRLPHPPVLVGEELHLPLDAVAQLWGMTLTREPKTGIYVLAKGGRELRVLMANQAYRIEIDRTERWVRVHYAGVLAKHYRACTGRGNNTPVGEFHIQNKGVWPGWRAYWGEYIPGGSPRNPLGARWLGTTARGRATNRVIGIHGTNQPSSIGQRISGGCIRLLNKHAIELYEVIPIGTRVTIHD